MNDCHAVLLDTVSIQHYIFQSNKLKENVGASHLVQEIYHAYLACALCPITGRNFQEELEHLADWKKSEADRPDLTKPVDIGYIGGGNALLFFRNPEQAKEFIRAWTKLLLVHTPGLTTAIALSPLSSFDPSKFRQSLDMLIIQLQKNKARYSPITALPRHGITAECSRSGVSAETYNELVKEYVSADVNARIEVAAESEEELDERYGDVLKTKYCFSNDFEKLGGRSYEDSHIAIVHIDGNDIGKLFEQTPDLKAIRALSKNVRKATESAFKAIVDTAVKRYCDIMGSLGFDDPKDHPTSDDKKKILPVRPIVLGGDDITFVCDGKLGIYFAKMFIEKFEKTAVNDEKLTACAGVAIIKTKYPFYRGYLLAEELCANAKKKRRDEDSSASFLDFHISMGGIAGKLGAIRQKHYKLPHGLLLYRPLTIDPKQRGGESLDLILEKTFFLKFKEEKKENLPNNKINELRETLTLSEEARRKFVMSLKYRNLELPEIEGSQYGDTLFENNKTPYFDMIEILRFYPDFALKEIGETNV